MGKDKDIDWDAIVRAQNGESTFDEPLITTCNESADMVSAELFNLIKPKEK